MIPVFQILALLTVSMAMALALAHIWPFSAGLLPALARGPGSRDAGADEQRQGQVGRVRD